MFPQYKTPEEARKAKEKINMAIAMGQPGIGGAMASIGSGLMQGNAQRQMAAPVGSVDATEDNPMPYNPNSVPLEMAGQHSAMTGQAMRDMQQQYPGFAPPPPMPTAPPPPPALAAAPPPMPTPPNLNSDSYRSHSGAPNPLARGRAQNSFNLQMDEWKKRMAAHNAPPAPGPQQGGIFNMGGR